MPESDSESQFSHSSQDSGNSANEDAESAAPSESGESSDSRQKRSKVSSASAKSRRERAYGPSIRLMMSIDRVQNELSDLEMLSWLDGHDAEHLLERKHVLQLELARLEEEFDEPEPPRLPRHTLKLHFDSVESCLAYLQGDEREFRHYFAFPSALVQQLAQLLFPGGTSVPRKGSLNSELSLLLCLARLHTKGSWFDMQKLFGMNEFNLNSHFVCALHMFDERFAALVDIERAALRFKPRASAYRESFRLKYIEKSRDQDFPERFHGVATIVDGMRQPISRPSNNACQRASYSGYTKQHCVLWGVVTAPDGLIVCITKPLTGRHRDPDFITDSVNVTLAAMELPALADSIFSLKSGVKPLPRRGQREALGLPKPICKRLSRVRISVEWVIGNLQRLFPLPFEDCKNKVEMGKVQSTMTMAVVLYNFYACVHGTQSAQYFDCMPPDLSDYMDDTAALE
jgi:hypothetical protein